MEAVAILLKQFETFSRRSLLPSSVFFLLFYLISLFYNPTLEIKINLYIIDTLKEINLFEIITMIITVVSVSFIMSILTQIIFDNWIN